MVAKLSSRRTRSATSRRHVAAALTHRNSDVGAFECRGVVDAVAGHGDDLAASLERLDEGEFVFWADSGEDVDVGDGVAELVRFEVIEVWSGESPVGGDPEVRGDRPAVAGWSPVIIRTLMPAEWAEAIAAWTSGRGGSQSETAPSQVSCSSESSGDQARPSTR